MENVGALPEFHSRDSEHRLIVLSSPLLSPIQAEARAEFAERSVQKLQKEVDRLEGESIRFYMLTRAKKMPSYFHRAGGCHEEKNG